MKTLSVLLLALLASSASAAGTPGLRIQWIDVEGGAATLIVTPAGESILIDCGYPNVRDAERIAKACKGAGLDRIDHLVITHWHLDHYGSLDRLVKLVPIRNYWDHGIPETFDEDRANFPTLIAAYKVASGRRSKIVHPGDDLPLKQIPGAPVVKMHCICSAGNVEPEKPGAPPNPRAKEHKPQADDPSDNARSVGFVLSYGSFCFLDLGDLTWNVEYKLIAPSDKIGPIDVYQTTHHGVNISNNPVLVQTIQPRVAVFNNGPRKGGAAETLTTLRRTPSVQAIYQMHRNVDLPASENTEPSFIANTEEKCQGESIYLQVASDSRTYTLTVGSKGKARRYETTEKR